MTELLPGADRPPWRAGACARTPADEKVSLPRELERQKRALERAYCDLARKVETVEKRVILMDMQMPKLDGYGATARLRATGYRGSIVALTAHSTKGDRWRCLAVGCDGFVSKPIARRTLLETVQRHAARAVAPPPPCVGGGAAARGYEPPA